jgi:hypothetical protein
MTPGIKHGTTAINNLRIATAMRRIVSSVYSKKIDYTKNQHRGTCQLPISGASWYRQRVFSMTSHIENVPHNIFFNSKVKLQNGNFD